MPVYGKASISGGASPDCPPSQCWHSNWLEGSSIPLDPPVLLQVTHTACTRKIPVQLIHRQRRKTGVQPTALAYMASDQVEALVCQDHCRGFPLRHSVPCPFDLPLGKIGAISHTASNWKRICISSDVSKRLLQTGSWLVPS